MDTIETARLLRLRCVELCHLRNASHLGGALSIIDILAVLFWRVAKVTATDPRDPSRDRIFYSKGHACTAYYAALESKGFYENLDSQFAVEGSVFTSHLSHKVPGVELSTGSLGHALPVACGVSLVGKRSRAQWRTFVILSDGELDEGSNWEAILFAGHHRLRNLCAVVDYNKIQSLGAVSEVLNLEPLSEKFRSFGWNTEEIDGHDHAQIEAALSAPQPHDVRPKVVIAHTVKGKGVSFMENDLAWHYKSPNSAELKSARRELADRK